jgi:23S rRNA (pseudouridine1915-N3)-methyltransferase
MRIHLLCVGRAKPGLERELYENYIARLSWTVGLREVEERRPLPVPERKEREAELLLGQLPEGAMRIVLDPNGVQMSSEGLADMLADRFGQGIKDIAFFVGGADGHGKSVLKAADFTLSLGKMTWPHMLVRAMLAEQLYRAQCIIAKHPYHRG